jgi:two-component system NarL family sensor kinase
VAPALLSSRASASHLHELLGPHRSQPLAWVKHPCGSKRLCVAQHEKDLRILSAVAEALNSVDDTGTALEQTLRLVAGHLSLRTGWVWLIDPDTGLFYNAASYNLPPYLQDPVRMAGTWCQCTEDFRSGRLTPHNVDMIECSRLKPAVKREPRPLTQGLRFHASIPLFFQKKPLGIMNVAGTAWRKLTAGELLLLSTVGDQVGVTVERARLTEESAKLARAQERSRIAREIHDTLAQSLTAIALQLDGALESREKTAPRTKKHVRAALKVAREGIDEVRRSLLDLRSGALEGKPLREALLAAARQTTSETGIRVTVETSRASSLAPRAEFELYRIVQEALANARRHADARTIKISLRAARGDLIAKVSDDGRGFDAEAHSTGQGIEGMRERAALIGGALTVSSRAGRGTTIRVAIPLEAVR